MIKKILPLLPSDTYIVGGAVRDRLLGRDTADIDLVVPAMPAALAKQLAQALGGTAFTLDGERGIERVSIDSSYIDIAMRQGGSFEGDLERRDFTINALAVPVLKWTSARWQDAIIDRFQGLRHLKQKWIVPVSKKTFADDPLRLLRAFRLQAELGFTFPTATLNAIRANRKRISKPAPERKRDEVLRLFSTPASAKTLKTMDQCGLLEEFFPEAKALRQTAPSHYGRGGVLKHTLASIECFEAVVSDKSWFKQFNKKITDYLSEKQNGYPRSAHCKWGLLLHDIGKPQTMSIEKGKLRFLEHEHVGANKIPDLARRYRWSGDEAQRYGQYVRQHMRAGNLANQTVLTDKAVHRFFRDLGEEAIAMLLVSLGDHLTYLTPAQRRKRNSPHELVTFKMIRMFFRRPEKVLPPKLITGYDVMRAFDLKPSPLIGDLLEDVQEEQSGGKIATKQDALAYLKGRVAFHRQKYD